MTILLKKHKHSKTYKKKHGKVSDQRLDKTWVLWFYCVRQTKRYDPQNSGCFLMGFEDSLRFITCWAHGLTTGPSFRSHLKPPEWCLDH